MQPRVETLPEKKLVGQSIRMSLADNKTAELWRSFMPRRRELQNSVGPDLYSVEVYDDLLYFRNFDPARAFARWAAMEVDGFEAVPAGMEPLTLPGGLYAVIDYKGPASAAGDFYRYIFTGWLPASGFLLDHRPHFALMGAKYKQEDPDSEEQVWIPVKRKE